MLSKPVSVVYFRLFQIISDYGCKILRLYGCHWAEDSTTWIGTWYNNEAVNQLKKSNIRKWSRKTGADSEHPQITIKEWRKWRAYWVKHDCWYLRWRVAIVTSSLEPRASSYLQAAAPESAWYLYLQLNTLRAGTVDVINDDESVNNSRSDVNTWKCRWSRGRGYLFGNARTISLSSQ